MIPGATGALGSAIGICAGKMLNGVSPCSGMEPIITGTPTLRLKLPEGTTTIN